MKSQDLRSTRLSTHLTISDVSALAGLRAATLQAVETGKHWPRRSTRKRLESVLGIRIDWVKTFGRDKGHLVFVLTEFVNSEGDGDPQEKITIARQTLKLIEETL